MKLTEEKIDYIIDDDSQYIYDDLWGGFDIEWVEDCLSCNNINEYDNEDLNEILKRLQDIQKEMQDEITSEEKETLYQAVDEFIHDSDIHLNPTDIGKVLVKLANEYLDE